MGNSNLGSSKKKIGGDNPDIASAFLFFIFCLLLI
jgi:hypothetical protein